MVKFYGIDRQYDGYVDRLEAVLDVCGAPGGGHARIEGAKCSEGLYITNLVP